jgi:putative PIN family toxin of toxin-antitoxin system
VRVVLDTNIIVSGLMSVTSPPAQILNAIRVGQVVAVMSEATFAELAHVLHRPAVQRYFLPDANSVISASSQFGVNGTVTIQSPNAPASGKISRWEKRRYSRRRCSTNAARPWPTGSSAASPSRAGTACPPNRTVGSPAR